jgi:hypothetical protein
VLKKRNVEFFNYVAPLVIARFAEQSAMNVALKFSTGNRLRRILPLTLTRNAGDEGA